MRWLRALLLAAGLLTSARALATDVKVIANTSVKADIISAPELRRVFLQESSSLGDGTRVQPVIEKDGPVHKAFLQEYLGLCLLPRSACNCRPFSR